MTQKELSALASEVRQIQNDRAQLDERAASIGVALMKDYPVDDRPEVVSTLLDDIDNLLE